VSSVLMTGTRFRWRRGCRCANSLVVTGRTSFRPGVTEDEQSTNGLSLATIGPQCSDGKCNGAEVVSNGRVVWNVEEFWEGPVSAAEGFLASFESIG
jgi:hypothetical protein